MDSLLNDNNKKHHQQNNNQTISLMECRTEIYA